MGDFDLKGRPYSEEQLDLIRRGQELLQEQEEIAAEEKEAKLLLRQAREAEKGPNGSRESMMRYIMEQAENIESLTEDFRAYLTEAGGASEEDSGEAAGEAEAGAEVSDEDDVDGFTLYLLEEIGGEAAEAQQNTDLESLRLFYVETVTKAEAYLQGHEAGYGEEVPFAGEKREVFREIREYAEKGRDMLEALIEREENGDADEPSEEVRELLRQAEEQTARAEELRESLEERLGMLIWEYDAMLLDRSELDGTYKRRDAVLSELREMAAQGSFEGVLRRMAEIIGNYDNPARTANDRAERRAVQLFVTGLWEAEDDELSPENERLLGGLFLELGRTDTWALGPEWVSAYEKTYEVLNDVPETEDVFTKDGRNAASVFEEKRDLGMRLRVFRDADNDELLHVERAHAGTLKVLNKFRTAAAGLSAAAAEELKELDSNTGRRESANSDSYTSMRAAVERIVNLGTDPVPDEVREALEELGKAAAEYRDTHGTNFIFRFNGSLARFRAEKAEELIALAEEYLGLEGEKALPAGVEGQLPLSRQMQQQEYALESIGFEKERRVAEGSIDPSEAAAFEAEEAEASSADGEKKGIRQISFEELARKLNVRISSETGKKDRRKRGAAKAAAPAPEESDEGRPEAGGEEDSYASWETAEDGDDSHASWETAEDEDDSRAYWESAEDGDDSRAYWESAEDDDSHAAGETSDEDDDDDSTPVWKVDYDTDSLGEEGGEARDDEEASDPEDKMKDTEEATGDGSGEKTAEENEDDQ